MFRGIPTDTDNTTLESRFENEFIEKLNLYLNTPVEQTDKRLELEKKILEVVNREGFDFDLYICELEAGSIVSTLGCDEINYETIFTLLIKEISSIESCSDLVVSILDLADVNGYEFVDAVNSYSYKSFIDLINQCDCEKVRNWFSDSGQMRWVDAGNLDLSVDTEEDIELDTMVFNGDEHGIYSADKYMINLSYEISIHEEREDSTTSGSDTYHGVRDAFRFALKEKSLFSFKVKDHGIAYDEKTEDALSYVISNSNLFSSKFIIECIEYAKDQEYDFNAFGRDYGSNNLLMRYLETCKLPDIDVVRCFLDIGFDPFLPVEIFNSITKAYYSQYAEFSPLNLANEKRNFYEERGQFDVAKCWGDVLTSFQLDY